MIASFEQETEDQLSLDGSDLMCQSASGLFKSEKFFQFVRIFNEYCRKEASKSGHFGYKDLTPEEISSHSFWAEQALHFLQELEVKGSVRVIERLSQLARESLERIKMTEEAHNKAEQELRDANKHLMSPFSS